MEGRQGENGYLNKKVAVFYDDGANHVSRKDGICTFNSSSEIVLDDRVIIPKNRVVRIEVNP